MASNIPRNQPLSLPDRMAIEDLMKKYCYFFDRNMPKELSELFTIDAQVDYGPEVNILKGQEQIFEMVSKGLSNTFIATSHHISNFLILNSDESTANSSCYLYAWHQYKNQSQIGHLWGGYENEFEKISTSWLIKSLRLYAVSTINFHRDTMHSINRRKF